jgi:hypothetical protein
MFNKPEIRWRVLGTATAAPAPTPINAKGAPTTVKKMRRRIPQTPPFNEIPHR